MSMMLQALAYVARHLIGNHIMQETRFEVYYMMSQAMDLADVARRVI